MDPTNLINLCKSFIQENLGGAVEVKQESVIIDYHAVTTYDLELANSILDDFENTLKGFEIAYKQLKDKKLPARFTNIPVSEHKDIWSLRDKDVGKLAVLTGYIRKISDVYHYPTLIRYECNSCGNVLPIIQQGDSVSKPTQCGCGRKEGFRILNRELDNLQKLFLEEEVNVLTGTQKPRKILVLLTGALCYKDIDKVLQPSKKIKISGLIKDKPLKGKSIEHIKYLEANNLEVLEDSIDTIELSNEDIEKIKLMSTQTGFRDKLINNMYGTIYGYNIVKKALFLQLIGADHLYRRGKLEERGHIMTLLIGPPGTAKTKFAKCSLGYLPNSRFTSGTGSSGIGLIASVTKDEEIGGWALEPGSMALSDKGMNIIDELDKMTKDDMGKLNNAMVDLEVEINKANIHQKISTDTIVLATANPINRVFDSYEPVWKQIGFPKDFLDRFDLIFALQSITSEEQQGKIVDVIFDKFEFEEEETMYDIEFVTKYIAYARNHVKPIITKEAREYIKKSYLNLTKPSIGEQAYFSSRLITNLIRVAKSVAKSKLKNEVTKDDAEEAVNLFIESFKSLDIIRETAEGNKLDIESVEQIVPKNQRDKYRVIKSCIESTKGEGGLSRHEDVLKKWKFLISGTEDELDELMDKLKSRGDVINPRPGYYKLID